MTVELPISALIALFAILGATLAASIGTVAYLAFRVGRLPTRAEHNALRDELRQEFKTEMAQLRQDMRAEMAQLRQDMRAEMAQLRQDMRDEMSQLRDDFRRSHHQLILTLAHHTHQEDGQAIFTLPPDTEPMPAPADD